MATVTHDHEVMWLQASRIYISVLELTSVSLGSHQQDCIPSGGSRGKVISSSFPASRGGPISRLMGPSSTFKARNVTSFSPFFFSESPNLSRVCCSKMFSKSKATNSGKCSCAQVCRSQEVAHKHSENQCSVYIP